MNGLQSAVEVSLMSRVANKADVYAAALDPCLAFHLSSREIEALLKFVGLFFRTLVLPPMALWDTRLRLLIFRSRDASVISMEPHGALRKYIVSEEAHPRPIVFSLPRETRGNPEHTFWDWYRRRDGPTWISGPLTPEARLALARQSREKRTTIDTRRYLGDTLQSSLDLLTTPGLTDHYVADLGSLYSRYSREIATRAEDFARLSSPDSARGTLARTTLEFIDSSGGRSKRSDVLWHLSPNGKPIEVSDWDFATTCLHDPWNEEYARALGVSYIPISAFGLTEATRGAAIGSQAKAVLDLVPWKLISDIRSSKV